MTELISSFCGLPNDSDYYKQASTVILPIPFDKTSTWLKGADKGPDAIIEASKYLEFYDIETDSEVYREGIFTAAPILCESSEEMVDESDKAVTGYLKEGKLVGVLGGEHSVSIGVIRSYARHYKNISVLHLDAHGDSRDSYEGSRYNHACVIARAREWVRDIVSVGIRSIDGTERKTMDEKKVFFAHNIQDSLNWIDDVVGLLTETVYITVDLDVFDPSLVPSTGTPEPGGLTWYPVMKLLKAVSKTKQVVGFDVVELCPSEAKASDFLAAKLIYTLLSYIHANKPDRRNGSRHADGLR